MFFHFTISVPTELRSSLNMEIRKFPKEFQITHFLLGRRILNAKKKKKIEKKEERFARKLLNKVSWGKKVASNAANNLRRHLGV